MLFKACSQTIKEWGGGTYDKSSHRGVEEKQQQQQQKLLMDYTHADE